MNTRLVLLFLLSIIVSFSYSQLPENGLIAHYTFDKNADDKSALHNNGKINGGVHSTEDRFGNKEGALHFNGVDGFISVANSTELSSPKTSITISAWVKLEKLNPSSNDLNLTLLSKSSGTSIAQYRFYQKRIFGDSKSTIFSSNAVGLPDNNYTNHPIEFGQWYFVALVLDDNWLQLYLNGKIAWVGMNNKAFVPNDAGIEIGRDNIGGIKYFCGSIDDLRIYNRGLVATEISALFSDTTAQHRPIDISIKLPQNIIKNTEKGKCYTNVSYNAPIALASDGSEVELKLIAGFQSGSAFNVGKHTITYQANVAETKRTGSFDITVIDNETPKFSCPADITVDADESLQRAKVIYPDVTVTDNCSDVKMEMIAGFKSGYLFPIGVNHVMYRATDAAGNVAECNFKVTVNEKTTQLKVKNATLPIKAEVPHAPLEKISPVKPEEIKAIKSEQTIKKVEPEKVKTEKFIVPMDKNEPISSVKKAEIQKIKSEGIEKKEEPIKVKTEKFIAPIDKGEPIAPIKSQDVQRIKTEIAVKIETPVKVKVREEKVVLPVKEEGDTKKEETLILTKQLKNESVELAKPDNSTSKRGRDAALTKPSSPRSWHFNCPLDTTIHLAANRKGIVYHYSNPTVSNPSYVESIQQTFGTHDGCFLPIGVHPFSFTATDVWGETQTCTYSVIVKDDLPVAVTVVPQKLEPSLNIGNDVVNYEHREEVDDCFLTVFLYDDGEEDNDTVSIIFNGQVVVNRDMIRLKEHGAIIRKLVLLHGNENYIIAKAWNTGKYGLNTLKIDVYEGDVEQGKKGYISKKPVLTKVLHSKPGNAGGMILKCN